MAILKARAENFSSSLDSLVLSDPSSSIPTIDGLSSGDGKKCTTESNMACTPLFLKADPHITGTISLVRVRILMPSMISSFERLPSSKYLLRSSSEASAAASSIASLYSSQVVRSSSGISSSV